MRPSEDITRMEPETGSRGGGPLCPLRWMFQRKTPQRWAAQPPGSAIPVCVPPKTSPKWNQRQGGGWGPAGFSIQAFGIPIGTVSLRSKPSGADTEVRPPATRWLAPGHGGLWGWVQRDIRWMRLGCPSGRLAFDPNPAERTQRSAPPRLAGWPPAMVVFGGGPSGYFDSGVWITQWEGWPSIQTQWSGHGGPLCFGLLYSSKWTCRLLRKADVPRVMVRFPDPFQVARRTTGWRL